MQERTCSASALRIAARLCTGVAAHMGNALVAAATAASTSAAQPAGMLPIVCSVAGLMTGRRSPVAAGTLDPVVALLLGAGATFKLSIRRHLCAGKRADRRTAHPQCKGQALEPSPCWRDLTRLCLVEPLLETRALRWLFCVAAFSAWSSSRLCGQPLFASARSGATVTVVQTTPCQASDSRRVVYTRPCRLLMLDSELCVESRR